jgi:hypothetical protein
MSTSRTVSIMPPSDVRVTLDVNRLNLLRQRRADVVETVSERFLGRRQCLTQAALKRAASGKPVRFRTVRHLAAFYGVGVEALIAPAAGEPPALTGKAFGVERLQCAALFDGVLATGQGRLVDVRGMPGSEKSAMTEECAEDARRRGFAALVLGLGQGAAEQDLHGTYPLARLVRALLYIGQGDAGADVEELVRSRCRALDLGDDHVEALLGMLAGPQTWPLPSTLTRHAAALGALIRQRAHRQPLLIALDDLQCADWNLMVMIDTVLPGTMDVPVVWMLACEQGTVPQREPLGARLETLPRTTFHLPGMPGARPSPCAASVTRLGRTYRVN